MSGKAKFGIFGDGKEIAQIALAKHFKEGDWRSGYCRDQTWMMARGLFDGEGVHIFKGKGWEAFQEPIKIERDALVKLVDPVYLESSPVVPGREI